MSIEKKHEVAVVRSNYKRTDVCNGIEQIVEMLDYKPKKDKLFIKPNLVDCYSSTSGIITSVLVVEAVICFFRKQYPEMEITVGEGSAVHTDFYQVLEKSGYKYLSKKYGVRFVNLDEVERIEVSWKYGVIKLPSCVFTHEYINIPKMKTHGQTGVSLGMKNQKGLLLKNDKKKFHSSGNLHDSIYQLSTIAIPDLTILDGIISLEGNGPTNRGKKKKTGLLLGSRCMPALDTVAADIMGFDPRDITHIPECRNIEQIGDDIPARSVFKKPDEQYKDFNVYTHFNSTGCTLCGLTIEDAFYKYPMFMLKVFLAGGFFRRRDIIFGKYDSPPEGVAEAICIGSCAAKLAEGNDFPSIKGCPPKPEEIQRHYLAFCKKK